MNALFFFGNLICCVLSGWLILSGLVVMLKSTNYGFKSHTGVIHDDGTTTKLYTDSPLGFVVCWIIGFVFIILGCCLKFYIYG